MMRRKPFAHAPALSIAEVSQNFSIERQAIQAIEARPKLQVAIEGQNTKLEQAELDAARAFALEYLQEKLNKHVDQLKADHPEAVAAAIDLRVKALEYARLENETSRKG